MFPLTDEEVLTCSDRLICPKVLGPGDRLMDVSARPFVDFMSSSKTFFQGSYTHAHTDTNPTALQTYHNAAF